MKPAAGQVWEEGYDGYPEDESKRACLVLGRDADVVGGEGAWRVLILEGGRAGSVTYLGEGWFGKPWARRVA